MNKYEKFIKYTLPQLVAYGIVGACISDDNFIRLIAFIAIMYIAVSNYMEGLNRV